MMETCSHPRTVHTLSGAVYCTTCERSIPPEAVR